MADFRGMVHGLVASTAEILDEHLLFGLKEQLPAFDWSELRDDPSNATPGWSFLKDERNHTLSQVDPWWLHERIGERVDLMKRFSSSGGGEVAFRWNPRTVKVFQSSMRNFQKRLMVLMHITGGQPARGPELLSLRHSNTVKGVHRGVFIENGLMVFVARYHKGYTMSGEVKIIHRYLPREVGEILLRYLWIALPFYQRMEADVWHAKQRSSHIWPAKGPAGEGAAQGWQPAHLSKALQHISREWLGVEFGIAAYRDLAIAISRRYLRKGDSFAEDEEDEEGGWDEDAVQAVTADEQAGHSSHVAGMVYARGMFDLRGEVASLKARFRESSTKWHRFLGFASALEVAPENNTLAASDGLQHEFEGAERQPKRKLPFESEAQEAMYARWKRFKGLDPDRELKALLGDEKAEFRFVQRPAVEAILAGESPVVAVMGTGGGKSLIFMLPAWCGPGGTTVVVVPLVALRQDLLIRGKLMGLSCEGWVNDSTPPDGARLVLVTPESAVGEAFGTFLNRLKATQQLDRIVIDECHVVLNDSWTFRRKLRRLGELCRFGVQMVLLTATLPPTTESTLEKRMGWQPGLLHTALLRASTSRPNLAYRTLNPEQRGQGQRRMHTNSEDRGLAACAELVRQKLAQYAVPETQADSLSEGASGAGAGGRIVVYCNTVAKTVALAEELNCGAYHSRARGKADIMQGFLKKGGSRVIVATSAFGLGIDVPDIRAVIHADEPRTLLDYAQESGRAGRDGLPAEAFICTDYASGASRERTTVGAGEEEEGESVPDEVRSTRRQQLDRILVECLLDESRCSRFVLDSYLDGRKDRVGCEAGEESCGRCARVGQGDWSKGASEAIDDAGSGFEPGPNPSSSLSLATSHSGARGRYSTPTAPELDTRTGTSLATAHVIDGSSGPDSDSESDYGALVIEDDLLAALAEVEANASGGTGFGLVKGAVEPETGDVEETNETEEAEWVAFGQFSQQNRLRQGVVDDLRHQVRSEALETEALRARLPAMRGLCPYCTRLDLTSNVHSLYWCHAPGSEEPKKVYNYFKTSLRQGRKMQPFSGCSFCFLPQEWCNRWEPTEANGLESGEEGDQRTGGWRLARGHGTSSCDFSDLILGELATGLVMNDGVGINLRARIEEAESLISQRLYDEEEGRLHGGDKIVYFNRALDDDLFSYLGTRIQWGGLECSRLLQEFWEVIKV